MDIRGRVTANPRVLEMRRLLVLTPRDMREMSTAIDVRFTRHERRLFSSEGRAAGQRWAPLSPAYRDYKRRVRPGRKKLVFDGDLRKSLTQRSHSHHVLRWQLKPQAFITVGTRDPKAAYHGPKLRNPLANPNVPVRDALAHTRAQLETYTDVVRAQFREKVRRFMRVARAWRRARRRP